MELVLERLPHARRNGPGYIAHCLAHDDRHASLSVTEGADGRALLSCHAGCSFENVIDALGLKNTDLFPKPLKNKTRRTICARYDYNDEQGQLLSQALRYDPKGFAQRRPNGCGGWVYTLGDVRRVLYRLPELLASDTTACVFIPEGEKDVEALRARGAVAICNPGGAGKWRPEYSQSLRNRHVVILPDNDEPGRNHARDIARALIGIATSVRVVPLPGLETKGDISDWFANGGTLEALLVLTDGTAEFEHASTVNTADLSDKQTQRRLTDAGNAERFGDLHARRFRYVADWCAWIYFDGQRWVRDVDGAHRRAALDTVRSIYEEASHHGETDERSAVARHALRSESDRALRAMLQIAQSDARLVIRASVLDADSTRYLLNVKNGTLDVRTTTLRPHDPCDFITKLAPVTFDPSVLPTIWEDFIRRVLPDPEVQAFLARYVGAALTGDTGDQAFLLANGSGCNGKSTVTSAVLRLFGDYGHQADFETFLQSTASTDRRGGTRVDLLALRGIRFVGAIEAGDGRRLNETLIKSLTGGDTITARGLYDRELTSFVPQMHLMLSANERPQIYGTDHAIWRRVLNVEFKVTIPEEERDASLLDRITASEALSGLLNWALLGAGDWYGAGTSNRLRAPEMVRANTNDYRAGQDILAGFLEDQAVLDEGAWVSTKELRAAYVGWCDRNGDKPLSDRAFAGKLRAHGLRAERRGCPAARGWTGIRLTSVTHDG
jgi:putative DNA primase/helicase